MADWIKKAPTGVLVASIVMGGVVALAVLAAFVFLSWQGIDTTEFRQWINTIGQILVFPFLGVTAAAATSAARSASRTEDQTNGTLAAKEREIATYVARDREALRRQIDRP
jgi:cobalamin biosynthesis protein CobD/CbiB